MEDEKYQGHQEWCRARALGNLAECSCMTEAEVDRVFTKEFTAERAAEKPLTVGGLRNMLAAFPDEMELIQTRYSDYSFQTASMWSVVTAIIVNKDEYLMRTHPSMTLEQLASAKKYFHIEGN